MGLWDFRPDRVLKLGAEYTPLQRFYLIESRFSRFTGAPLRAGSEWALAYFIGRYVFARLRFNPTLHPSCAALLPRLLCRCYLSALIRRSLSCFSISLKAFTSLTQLP